MINQQQQISVQNTNQQPFPAPAPLTASQDQKLHIKNIHESITEEMLWQHFKTFGNIQKVRLARDRDTQKSKGYAKITYSNAESAKSAKNELNYSFLLNKEIAKDQKRILISKDLNHDQFQNLKTKNIFLEGIPKEKIDPKEFYNQMTKYGEILSLVLPTEKDKETLTGYGFILFEKIEDNDKFLALENIEFQKKQIKVEKYVSQGKRQHEVKKSIYIKNFYRELTDEESQTVESRQKAAETIKAILMEKLSKYGDIQSCIVDFDPQTNKKSYAFLSMKDDNKLNEFIQQYHQNKDEITALGFKEEIFINAEVNKALKNIEDRFLLIKNLKVSDIESENQEQQEKLQKILSYYGKVESISVFKSKKPVGAVKLMEANQARVVMKTEDDATKVLVNYLYEDKIKPLFNNNIPHGGITYLLPKSERQKMLRSKEQERKQQIAQFQVQEQIKLNQQMYQINNFSGRHNQRQGRGPQQFNQYPQRGQQMRQQGYQQGRQQFQQQPNMQQQQPQRTQQPPIQQQQSQRSQQPQQTQPKPIAQQASAPAQMQTQQQSGQSSQSSQPITLEELKKNLDKFTKLDQKQQSQILGNLLFPKVEGLCKELSLEKELAPKITGMLIDFSVFDITDIVEILENNDELKDRITEADNLIKQQK